MTVGVVLQARVSSSRLPGKVLLPLMGEPMLVRQLERLRHATTIDDLVIATSDDPSDDELTFELEQRGYSVFRGSLNNVLERFIGAGRSIGADTVVRLTGDCPLIDARIVDECVSLFKASDCDYASNTHPPTFPDGLDVEVTSMRVLADVLARATQTAELEHVTWGIWNRPTLYRVVNFANPVDMSHHRWTVDTPQDFGFVEWVYSCLYEDNPNFATQDVLDLLLKNPSRLRTDAMEQRNSAIAQIKLEES